MSTRRFFDSNVLVYAAADHPFAATARRAIEASQVISVQVLNEFAHVARRKFGRSAAEIRAVTLGLRQTLEVVPLTLLLHDQAIELCERYRYSLYDSLIVAAALHAGHGTAERGPASRAVDRGAAAGREPACLRSAVRADGGRQRRIQCHARSGTAAGLGRVTASWALPLAPPAPAVSARRPAPCPRPTTPGSRVSADSRRSAA